MGFRCEDLPQHGVVLIPPGGPDYDPFRADILHRLANPVAGSPPELPQVRAHRNENAPAAVLLNRAALGIAAMYQIWTFDEGGGRKYNSMLAPNTSVLLPFAASERQRKPDAYWRVILPGSKRLVTADGEILGDNSDVRPPAADEMWTGGVAGGFGGSKRGPVAAITLAIDGVFFTDGSFAGPNRGHFWETVVYRAEAYQEVARLAQRLHDDGAPPERILSEVHTALGSPPDTPGGAAFPRPDLSTPDDVRARERAVLWRMLAGSRRRGGDERTVYMMLGWLDTPIPKFRKL